MSELPRVLIAVLAVLRQCKPPYITAMLQNLDLLNTVLLHLGEANGQYAVF